MCQCQCRAGQGRAGPAKQPTFHKNIVPIPPPPPTLHLRKVLLEGFPKRYNVPRPPEHHFPGKSLTLQKPLLVDSLTPPSPPAPRESAHKYFPCVT